MDEGDQTFFNVFTWDFCKRYIVQSPRNPRSLQFLPKMIQNLRRIWHLPVALDSNPRKKKISKDFQIWYSSFFHQFIRMIWVWWSVVKRKRSLDLFTQPLDTPETRHQPTSLLSEAQEIKLETVRGVDNLKYCFRKFTSFIFICVEFKFEVKV